MRQMPLLARIYLIITYVLGFGACAWLINNGAAGFTFDLNMWLLTGGLLIVAAACQIFVVKRAGTDHSDHLTQAPLFAALLLLPNPLFAAVLIATFIPEWYMYRRRWFIQLFNIASYLLAGAAGEWVLVYFTGSSFILPGQAISWPAVTIAGLLFLVIQTTLLALVLKLARGEGIISGGLFAPRKLFVEVALLAVGLGFVVCWHFGPIFGVIAALPLALIFEALHVPNLKAEASTDPKTGLANIRHFNMVLARDLERAERGSQPLSLLMCDLDYLRNINNTYGHQAGDIVLQGIAEIIRWNTRGSDVAARFGGEEFVILLADQDADDAHAVAERLRRELEETAFAIGPNNTPVHATISIGVATYPQDGRTSEALMREADLAVYKAKRDGRNRVVVSGRATRELAGEWAREHLAPIPVAAPVQQQDEHVARWQFVSAATRDQFNIKPKATPKRRSANKTRTRRTDGPTPIVLALIGAIFLAGLISIWPGLTIPTMPNWGLILFAGLCVAVEQFAVDIAGRGKTSVAIVAVLGAAFLFGEIGVLVSAVALSISVAIKARSPLHRVLFNIGNVLLSAQAALLLFELIGGRHLGLARVPLLLAPAALSGLLFYAINHILLSMIRGMHEERTPWQIWQADYRWLWPHYMLMGVLGLAVAFAYRQMGTFGVLAMALPVGMMHLAFKQYITQTNLHVEDLRRVNGRLTDSYESTLQALTRALDTRDEETEEHSQRVRRYAELIGQQLNLPESEHEDIARGALLHDIGKIGVPDAILLKPGKLTDEERAIMRKHPEIGYAMIAHIPFLSRAAQVVLHHHEAFDGSGYPSGLSGSNIPLGARIFAVADTFDAMTSDRPYRAALAPEIAFAELRRCSGTQFDPEIVEAFLAIAPATILATRANHPEPGVILELPVVHRSIDSTLVAS